jgi:hypothetical protein
MSFLGSYFIYMELLHFKVKSYNISQKEWLIICTLTIVIN